MRSASDSKRLERHDSVTIRGGAAGGPANTSTTTRQAQTQKT